MSLTPGSRVGPYEIVGAIGKGGMGEVYRARDHRLARDVAIKVLPPLFAHDPDRLARFEREARTLAALNHPRVAQVYGLIDLPDAPGGGLVLEFIDGEDLSALIARGGRMATADALAAALQITEALEAAHAVGIIHRDLKPANIKVRTDGEIKVLDFGLAKALAPAGAELDQDRAATITSPLQLSQLGLILGTAAYMAPEQARGRAVDKRADIWAFGCVLYEMLTAHRPFTGEDVTETLAAIVRAEPDWSALPRDTPPAIRILLRRCLQKDPRERLPDIGAARLELADATRGTEQGESSVPSVSAATRHARRAVPMAAAVAAALLGLLALGAFAVSRAWSREPAALPIVASILPPGPLIGAPALRMAVSPDGRSVAFIASQAGGPAMLWVRTLDQENARMIPDTRNAASPFWSPDGRSIAFFADGNLRRVDAAAGPPATICEAVMTPPGTWSRDNFIYFTGTSGPLIRVSAAGGAPAKALDPTPGVPEVLQQSPFMLPDQRHIVYTAAAGGSRALGLYAASVETRAITPLIDAASNAAYANGHLFYLRGTTLLAQPFDPVTLVLSESPVPVATGIQINPSTGTGAFSVSQTGVLAYQKGSSAGNQMIWMDRKGTTIRPLGMPGLIRDVQISPDGKWASATLPDNPNDRQQVWIFDLIRGVSRPFTFAGESFAAVWSPDSTRLAYAVRRSETSVDLVMRPLSGKSEADVLLADQSTKYPLGFSPDGQSLLYAVLERASSGKTALLPLDGSHKPLLLDFGGRNQIPAEVSPDGRWIAYSSNESGRSQVYVKAFPSLTGKWQVSTDTGYAPRWRSDSKELFFLADDHFQVVDVSGTKDGFEQSPARTLFDVRLPTTTLGLRSTYAVAPGGQQFLFDSWDASAASAPITVVINWPATIKK